MESFPDRFNFSATRMKVKFEERADFVRDIAQHLCVSVCYEEIAEVRRGLGIQGLCQILENHYEECKEEFLLPKCQRASDIMPLFREIKYITVSDEDHVSKERRDIQENIIYNKTNFIETLEIDGAM